MKRYNPTTPSRRHMTTEEYPQVTRSKPEKSLVMHFSERAGRNNRGRITVRRRGGGHKQMYRMVDFGGQEKLGIPGVVKEIEYDPNRNVLIALIHYPDGEKRYILLPEKVRVGFSVVAAEKTIARPGNRMCLKSIPEGVNIHNIELNPGRGGKAVRGAGTSAMLISLEGEYAQIRMPSTEIRLFHKDCMATIGTLSNADHANLKLGKAGRSRHRGIRPAVRGKAMNPVDHPHGGGEGCNPIGMKHPKTPSGKNARGVFTRHRKYTDRWILRSRHSVKAKQ